jgi:hypothetical protein
MIPRVKATRLTQPYRRGTRNPSPALTAMTKGRTYAGTNPQDLTRSVQKLIRAGGGRGTGPRPARPARPVRATLSRIDPPVQPKKIPLDALIAEIDFRLDERLLPNRSDYASLHGRRAGLRAMWQAADAIVETAANERRRQADKHESTAEPVLGAA